MTTKFPRRLFIEPIRHLLLLSVGRSSSAGHLEMGTGTCRSLCRDFPMMVNSWSHIRDEDHREVVSSHYLWYFDTVVCKDVWPVNIQLKHLMITTTVLQPFFRDHLSEPVPEENFWTLWCERRLTEADTVTIRLDTTPSWLTSAHLHRPPFND